MRLITTISLALSAATVGTLAAPTSTTCKYESDKVHVTCLGANEGYARGVDVTYNMSQRPDVEAFMRRADAIDVLARGMQEEVPSPSKRASTLEINHVGDLDKTQVTLPDGTVKPLSALVKPGITDKPATKPSKPDPKPSSTAVGVGQGCKFGNGNINRRIATCEVGVKRELEQHLQERGSVWGDTSGDGNAQGNICQFGNGNIGRRDEAHVTCEQTGSPIYGANGGKTVVHGKRDDSGSCKYYEQNRRFLTDDEVDSLQKRGDSAGDGNVQGNICQYGNGSKRDNGGTVACAQQCSPVYGANGGSVTYFTRRFDMANIDDVLSYHNEVRSILPGANPNFRRDSEICDGIPVGPVGPQATYVTRGLPDAVQTVGAGATYVPRRIPDAIESTSSFKPLPLGHGPVVFPDRDGRQEPTPIIKDASSTRPAKRCINTPIAPVGPTVSYMSKDEYKKQHGGQ